MSAPLKLAFTSFVCLMVAYAAHAQSADATSVTKEAIMSAQTADYCEMIQFPERFKGKVIRVHAFYITDFEEASIDLPSCWGNVREDFKHIPMTWVDFDDKWESRTKRRVRHAVDKMKYNAPTEVVFIGLFKSDGHYGPEDTYPYQFEVYKVESAGATK